MDETSLQSAIDDPRKLVSLLARVAELSRVHSVGSVMVGLSAPAGDRLFPEFVEFLRSALRVEDGIFRMTRERAVVHLADIDLDDGRTVTARLLEDFLDEFPTAKNPCFEMNFFLVPPGCDEIENKVLLQQIFPSRMLH